MAFNIIIYYNGILEPVFSQNATTYKPFLRRRDLKCDFVEWVSEEEHFLELHSTKDFFPIFSESTNISMSFLREICAVLLVRKKSALTLKRYMPVGLRHRRWKTLTTVYIKVENDAHVWLGQCYKTFYVRNFLIFILSWSVWKICQGQAF